ncbi:TPA: hypothetical protein ACTXXA_002685 [Legionella anisa]
MPKFLINTTDILLLDVPRGKRYVGEPEVLKAQSAQKGDTCALYALNSLRFRFGKKDSEHQKERLIESVFSNYRRGLNQIDADKKIIKQLFDEIEEFLSDKEDKQITPEVVIEFIKKLDADLEDLASLITTDASGMKKEIERYKKLCMDYLDEVQKAQYEDFEEYARLKEYIDHVALAEKTLNSLTPVTGLDAKVILKNYLTAHVNSVVNCLEHSNDTLELTLDNPQFSSSYYHQAIVNLAASCYKLEGSEWDPSQPIEELMTLLKELGPLVIYTEPCVLFEPQHCVIETSAEKYQIYTKKLGAKGTDEGSHSLVIVGAEHGKETDYVYLMDPNFPAPLNGPCPFYKITYNELLEKLLNIYGVSLQTEAEKIRGPFAFQAQKGNFDRLCQFVDGSLEYEKVVNPKKYSIDRMGELLQLPNNKLTKM